MSRLFSKSISICYHLVFLRVRPTRLCLVRFKNNHIKSNEFNNQNAIESIRTLLQCSIEEACFLYQNHNNITNNMNILKHNGIEPSTVKDNFWLLKYDKGQLEPRLKLLNKWLFKDLNNGISILQLPFGQLMKHTVRISKEISCLDGTNRITYFALFVKCKEKQACDVFMKYTFMLALRLDSMKEILLMLTEQGVQTEDLLHDLWLFRYSPQFISARIKYLDHIRAREKCKIIKPWMLRCPEPVLNRYLELRDENIAALGSYSNLRELLSSELALSSDDVQEMILKHPPVAKISYSKAKDMIDFLKAQGFDSKMIYHVPRVLCHKQATLMARMVELKKVSPNLINLHNLCRNKKDYVSFLNKMS
uniref:Uncharacterized protein n=1 Tax=Homalodisca liturata TaxID=320908 RepID=A0A1B6IH65_9HEMI